MKILGFSSGAAGRETNSDRMVKAILDKSGHETEFVKLTDLTYSGCKGCVQLCAGPQVCMLEDDLLPWYQKIKEADAVVLGSPVYRDTINANMAAFVERFFGYSHVALTIAKKPVILALSGAGKPVNAPEAFINFLNPYYAVNILGVINFGSGIPPCFCCGRHRECTIGGLYGAVGKKAHSMTITPEYFRRWEDDPATVAALEEAAGKLADLA